MSVTPRGETLSWSWFERAVREYHPLSHEVIESPDRRFLIGMNHLLKNRDRIWLALQTASRYFPDPPFTVADLGTYPGSLLRLVRRLFPAEACRLIGIGLMTGSEFASDMRRDCQATTLTVNLDPRNDQLREKDYPTRIPLDDNSAHLIFGLEIIEHLVSPSHLLAEAYRITAPGGHVLITTPNVTRIGNIFKLLVGRSNFDRLIRPDYVNPDDEWRPHFREYTLAEVAGFLERAGFEVVERRHFTENDTRYNIKSLRQRLIDCVKIPFHAIPHFRGSLLAVARKPRAAA